MRSYASSHGKVFDFAYLSYLYLCNFRLVFSIDGKEWPRFFLRILRTVARISFLSRSSFREARERDRERDREREVTLAFKTALKIMPWGLVVAHLGLLFPTSPLLRVVPALVNFQQFVLASARAKIRPG